MREIIVTRRRLGTTHIIQVDDADYDRVIAAGPWSINSVGCRTFYAFRNVPCPTGQKTTQYLHRFILGEACAGLQVDHIDGNGLNDQQPNLRVCTKAENGCNQQLRKTTISGFKGVSWITDEQRWRAQIGVGGRRLHLGRFDTPEEAHAAYCAAAIRSYGEFARFK